MIIIKIAVCALVVVPTVVVVGMATAGGIAFIMLGFKATLDLMKT